MKEHKLIMKRERDPRFKRPSKKLAEADTAWRTEIQNRLFQSDMTRRIFQPKSRAPNIRIVTITLIT
jgi:hypothetical protein